MATKKKVKRVQSSKSKVQSHAHIASLEKQIAALEEHIAALQTGGGGHGNGGHGVTTLPDVTLPSAAGTSAATSPLPQVVYPLAPPSLENVTAIGSRFIRVSWIPVPNASGYVVRYSPDSAFVNNVHAVTVNATDAAITLSGLEPNTTYYVGIMATGEGSYLDSPFSVAKSAKTGVASNDETATHIQDWLAEMQTVFQNFATLMPELETTVLSPAERRRLNGSGVRRYGFIDKVSDVAEDNPQFWPSLVNGENGAVDYQAALKERLRKIEAIRNLLVWLRTIERVAADLFLITSHDAFLMANTYYGAVRSAARSNLLGARQIFQLLQLFWRRRRNPSAEPTQREVMRDVRALLRGTKEGEIVVRNESDKTTKGEKVIIDNTRKKPRNGFKEIETGSADLSTDDTDVG